MNRYLTAVAAALLVLATAGSAHAVTAKWCFKWQGSYEDAGFGEDYLNVDDAVGPNEIAARYTYVKIEYWGSSGWTGLWDGYLNRTGCSPNMTILGGFHYRFTQSLLLNRDGRVIEVHPDGEDWTGATDTNVIVITTPSPLPTQSSYDAPVPTDSGNNRLMPAMTQFMSYADVLDLPTGVDIDVSTWGPDDIAGDHVGLGCGSGCSPMGGSLYHVCISDASAALKHVIAHELGHTISRENDGPNDGSYWGSDGFYQATGVDNRCDCTYIDGYSHCPTSREFTGSGQKEGFSHFIAAASYNSRAEVDGVFVFYKDLMEWSSTHDGTLPAPSGIPFTEVPHPYPGYLSTSDDVKWLEHECSPAADFQPHMSNEWDWLSFFWNLWTDGGVNKYSVDEINEVWNSINDNQIAYDCCLATEVPAGFDYWVASDCIHTTEDWCYSLYRPSIHVPGLSLQ